MPARTLFASIKFRIVTLAATTGVLAAIGAAVAVMHVTGAALQHQLLSTEGQEREQAAAMLSGKIETIKHSLVLVARHSRREQWQSAQTIGAFLEDKPALGALFDSVSAISPEGLMLARVEGGKRSAELVNVGDREFFRRALRSDQPVVSEPIRSRLTGQAIVVVAMAVLEPDGQVVGVLLGTLRLRSNSLFTDTNNHREDGVRDLVMDRQGVMLWHTDGTRVLQRASGEPGLQAALARWLDIGSPIDTTPTAALDGQWLIASAGIPLSDWMLVRLTPRDTALAPMAAARRTAAVVALVAGLAAAVLAGVLAVAVVRPIDTLRRRAAHMLSGGDLSSADWPAQGGEIGAMSQAFQLLLQLQQRQRDQAQSLLLRLQAVLDNADVGLALTRNGRFEMVSQRLCLTFGFTAEAVLGQSTQIVHPSPEAYEALSRRAHPSFMQHGCFDGEVELVRASGELFWARMRGRAVVPGDRSQGTIWVISDVTREHAQHEQLSWAASHDLLTGLANRAAFESQLKTAAAAAAEAPFHTLFIDLDRFKQVNDSGGHAAGDAMLRAVATTLQACVRQGDLVARLGGDEFAVLLPLCPPARARAVAENLRAAVEACHVEWAGQRHQVGASIGLVAAGGSAVDAEALLRRADEACYRAKHGGRNRVAECDAVAEVA